MNDEIVEKAKRYAQALAANPGHELGNMAQAASNTAAENVSVPVDVLAAGLRKIGLPVPQNALGGSEWMRQNGFTREVEPGVSKSLGEAAGLLIPVATFKKFQK